MKFSRYNRKKLLTSQSMTVAMVEARSRRA
jgi:hypothetical protein